MFPCTICQSLASNFPSLRIWKRSRLSLFLKRRLLKPPPRALNTSEKTALVALGCLSRTIAHVNCGFRVVPTPAVVKHTMFAVRLRLRTVTLFPTRCTLFVPWAIVSSSPTEADVTPAAVREVELNSSSILVSGPEIPRVILPPIRLANPGLGDDLR